MPWQQLKIQVQSDKIEPLEHQLLEHGAVSISYLDAEDQPVFQLEPGSTPLWDNTFLVCLFEEQTDISAIVKWLKSNPVVSNADSLEVEILEDQDWERAWMQDFHAMQFGERLWICPSWQTPPDPNAINIMLDPGLAFGSGSHATTSMCLRWLEQADIKDKQVIDYGCGSGILAIAAALLGSAHVHCVDNDPQAIDATLDNSQRNNIAANSISAYLPQALPPMQADVLLANILAEPLLGLASLFAGLVKPQGKIVLSGLLENQADEILRCYEQWFEMDAPMFEQEWLRLTGTRRD